MIEELDAEIELINKQIEKLSIRLVELRAERKKILAPVKGRDYGFLPEDDPNIERLVEFIQKNPGSDKTKISLAFPKLDTRTMSNLLLKARRNRGLIVNRGTRQNPAWFVSESA